MSMASVQYEEAPAKCTARSGRREETREMEGEHVDDENATGEQSENVFLDATDESLGDPSPGTELYRREMEVRSLSLQEIFHHDDAAAAAASAAAPAAVTAAAGDGDMVIQPTLLYRNRLKDFKAIRELIYGRLGLALIICTLITPFISALFVGVMTSSLVNCKSSWYITLTSSSLAIPCILGMLVLAVQITSLMDKYDLLWIDFHELETRAVYSDPSLYCCLTKLPVWRRNLIVYLVLIAYVCTVLLVLAGPYLFLCGAFTGPR